jgi:cobalt-zinc-cadmium resistance protein CzcA
MNEIIAFALRMRALMVAFFVLIMIAGLSAFARLNIEAYPDPVPPLVDIVTQNPGQSAEEIERYITIPIEVDVATAPYLSAMRTISLFGLSDVKLQFTYDLTYEEAEQKVLNRLSQLPALQNQAQATISPWSPTGEIYRYQLVGPPGYSVMDLKTLQDWVIARRFRAVPGVIDVTGWGGKTKIFEIQIDREKLVAYGLTLPQVLQTLSNSNINVGGNTVDTEVNRAIFFSAAIIIVGFIPLFTLSGVEGHIFGPMAKTYAYALAGALLATFTVVPAFSAFLLHDRVRETETIAVSILRRIYTPVVEFAVAHRILALATAGLLLALALFAVRFLGLEFLPHLEEGNLWIRATMPPSISLEEGNDFVNRMRLAIKNFPEVETVVSQQGRPDDGTDATGFFNAEFFAPLKPTKEWRKGVTKDKLIEEVNEALETQFPGVNFNFSQYIQDNVEEAVSGVKGENSVKLIGNDIVVLTETAEKIKAAMSKVRGVADLAVFTSLGQPTLRIDIDRKAAARYGLAPGDVNAAVQTAVGGQAAGDLYEEGSDRHFPLIVRLAPKYRQSIETISSLTIAIQDPVANKVAQIPLGEVATINLVTGPAFIYREQQQRYIPIKFSVRGRDLGSTVIEAQRRISEEVHLPAGYRLEWSGEFGNLQEAIARLRVIVPLTILLIGILLYINFASLTDTLLGVTVIPMAMIGGVFALLLTGTPFSVSAAIGFIALFGIAVMEGIILLSYFNQLIEGGASRGVAILQACQTRFRPVMMTCIAACVGLLPAALSTAIGAQVQRPLALVVVGGILLTPILVLVILPVLIDVFSRRTRPDVLDQRAVEPAE